MKKLFDKYIAQSARPRQHARQRMVSQVRRTGVCTGPIRASIFVCGRRGIEANAEKSFELYLKAAEQGHAEAQYEVGLLYGNGYGVEKNAEKAAEWYRKSAAQGNEFARRTLEYAARARSTHD